MKATIWLAAGLCLGLATSATAQGRARVRFQQLDANGDGVISRAEWRGSDEQFYRLDRNRNNVLTVSEFISEANEGTIDRFTELDGNRDGRLTRDEWEGSDASFDALDANGDGILTRREALGIDNDRDEAFGRDEFSRADTNRDGVVAREEWRWNMAAFDRLDANRDGRLTRREFNNPSPTEPAQTPAYRAGYERGRAEGIQAGREDKPRHWDLEGQRELETADSGYEPRFGARADYQAGYRIGFRRGYHEGFGPR